MKSRNPNLKIKPDHESTVTGQEIKGRECMRQSLKQTMELKHSMDTIGHSVTRERKRRSNHNQRQTERLIG